MVMTFSAARIKVIQNVDFQTQHFPRNSSFGKRFMTKDSFYIQINCYQLFILLISNVYFNNFGDISKFFIFLLYFFVLKGGNKI